jgi:signal recognition particle subunit SRP54
MFESLSDKLTAIFSRLKGKGHLTELDVREALKQVRMALLEADVHFRVAKEFVAAVEARAVGQEVLKSLTPGQQVVKVVREELAQLLGDEAEEIRVKGAQPYCLMLVGLQGSGKTTSAAKLARILKEKGKRCLLGCADVTRPAAFLQLKRLADQVGVPVYDQEGESNPVAYCTRAARSAQDNGYQVVIFDTAGRLAVDNELMEELRQIKARVQPQEVLLVADGMTGQDAVNLGKAFHDSLGLDGVILTKMDGDARGGAALSLRSVTGCSIRYLGVGEKLDGLELFHPDRMAQRILGMGDVLSLIEKASTAYDQEQAEELERKVRKDSFTLEDFRDQLQQIKKMGPLEELISMIPGLGRQARLKDVQIDERELTRVEAIINSMTIKERRNHLILNGSRRKRIARGSGTTVADVNRLVKKFMEMRKMMKKVSRSGFRF